MARYAFLTTWALEAPLDDVWREIHDTERWPEWWRGVTEATETDPGAACGIGRRGRYTWRSRVPYPVRFEVVATDVQRPHLLAGEASGELEGTGIWRLRAEEAATEVTYEWNVATTKRWMNAIGPVAGPFFRWNHDEVMRWGGEGLARHLGCRLLASA